MAPWARDSSWFLTSSPRQVAASLVASMQNVTSSVWVVVAACCQCGSLGLGCRDAQDQHHGAWFDSDKVQVEHPFCYVNPVVLSEGAPNVASTLPDQSSTHNNHPKTFQSETLHHSKPPQHAKLLQQPKPLQRKSTSNGLASVYSDAPQGVETANTLELNKTVFDKPLLNGVDTKCTAVVHKNGRVRSLFVESFAAKLEADLKKLECDRQRAEGEVMRPLAETKLSDNTDFVPKYICRDNKHKNDFFLDDQAPDSPYHYGNFNDEKRSCEVWKPSELEDVFECYNKAAFYCYGTTLPIREKFTSKSRGEKYEEIFPVTFHNNNNIIKVYKPAGECEQPLAVSSQSAGRRPGHPLTHHQLLQYIQSCVRADIRTDVTIPCPDGKTSLASDHNIYFGSRSFNNLLMFDLVKSVMSECSDKYPHSLSLCVDYPVHLVQNRVLSILDKQEDSSRGSPSGMQVFKSGSLYGPSDLQETASQEVANRLVESVVATEVRIHDQHWHNFTKEEHQIKEAISTELFDDLISETASLFGCLLKQKFLQ
ncbi:uncharacterized protein [Procambarus clarkii]|uniref:uncharacterized protein n=1 Tax=Procambarus clarkii TaxID=6728 RepID=UPI0037449A36